MEILRNYVQLIGTAAIPIGGLFVLERLFPIEEKQPLRRYVFNLGYFLFALLIILHLSPPLMRMQASIREMVGPLPWTIAPPQGPAAKVAVGLLLVFVWDFFYYWVHRAMHATPLLWEVHKLHHDETALASVAAQRIHLSSYVLGAFVVTLPVSMLFPGIALPTVMATVFFNGLAYFNHANLRLSLGFLTPVLTGPQLHRLHHSMLEQHLDRNFAAFFPVLDVVFGTYCKPEKGEFPATGLRSPERTSDLVAATIGPFVAWGQMLARRLGWSRGRRAVGSEIPVAPGP